MRNVSNSKCISNISRKSLKANRKRNVILGVAIALTALMLTTVFTVTGSMIKGMENATMYQVGTDLHGGFKFLTREQYDALSKDSEISELCYNIIVGFSDNEELREDYTEIRYTDKLDAEHSFAMPQDGRLPEDDDEIATCTAVLDDFGLPHETGQKIHLKINNGFEVFEGDFTVCGIWEKPAATLANQIFVSKGFQEAFSPAWESKSDMEKAQDVNSFAGAINPGFNFHSPFNIEAQMEDLKERLGWGDEVNDGVNWAYSTASMDFTSTAVMLFLLIIIMAAGYLIIFNVFNISVTADIQYYGLLKTIGTTNRQLKRIIVKQAIFISAFAIPAGLICGYLVSMAVIPLIVKSLVEIPVTITFNIWIFVLSAVFAWATVRISCIRPCRIVRKVSPVEAVRYIDVSHPVRNKSRKTHRVTPVSMAWQNIGRTRRKTAAVVLSLALSIVMLNVSVSVVSSFDEDLYVNNFANSDFTVADASLFNSATGECLYEVSKEDIEYFSKLEGIEDAGAIYMAEGLHKISSSALEKAEELYNEWDEKNSEYGKQTRSFIFDDHCVQGHLYGLDRMLFENMEMDAGTLDWDKFRTGKYAIISSPLESLRSADDAAAALYQVGDSIDVELPDGTVKTYEVMGIGDVAYAMGPEHSHFIDMNVSIASEEFLNYSNSDKAMKLCFNADDAHLEAAETAVSRYCDETRPLLDYESRNKFKKDFKETQQLFLLLGGAMSLMLALIGILNFINLTYTSINERRNELKTLNAVGMTLRQIKKMLAAEGVIRIALTFAAVLTFGLGLNRALVTMIAGQMVMFRYQFVAWPMLACIPVFLLIAIVVPRSIMKVSNQL